MDLMKLLRSLEEFVFEGIALLFFYPRTLLRIMLRPLELMQYAERQEAADDKTPYDDAVSPPLLLLITLLLSNAVGFALHVNQDATAAPLARELLDSPQNLLLFRSLLFSVIPLTASLVLLHKLRQAASRTTLRQPFFAQCYVTSPFALVMSLGLIATRLPGPGFGLGGALACAMAFAWLVAVQAAWFRSKLPIGRLAALVIGVGLLAAAFSCVVAAGVLIAIA